jgi:hypothetical protein
MLRTNLFYDKLFSGKQEKFLMKLYVNQWHLADMNEYETR